MKLKIIEITPGINQPYQAILEIGDERVRSEIIEETQGGCLGMNFSNSLFANILLFAGCARDFCTAYFEYRDGMRPLPPWDMGDVDIDTIKQAKKASEPTSAYEANC